MPQIGAGLRPSSRHPSARRRATRFHHLPGIAAYSATNICAHWRCTASSPPPCWKILQKHRQFSIDDTISSGNFGFGEGKQIRLEAIFFHGEGDHLFETALSSDQVLTELEDGNVKLIATVADTPQLGWWLLGLGDGVEVVKPAALRKSVAETIARMQATYQL